MPGVMELAVIGGILLLIVGVPVTVALVVVACLRKKER